MRSTSLDGKTGQYPRESREPLQYAGFGPRAAAALVDFLILAPILLGIEYLFSGHSRFFYAYWMVPSLALGLWYEVYLVARYGGTPGKLLLGLRIAMVDGSEVTPRAAMLRYSVLFVLVACEAVATAGAALQMTDQEYLSIGYLERMDKLVELASGWNKAETIGQFWMLSEFFTMLLNDKRRAIHDFIAGTVVLK